MVIYISVFIGAVVYGLIDYFSDNTKDVLTKKYLLTMLGNIVSGIALIWLFNLDKANFDYNGFDWAKPIGASFGVFGQKLFKAGVKMADKKIKTKLGINESKG